MRRAPAWALLYARRRILKPKNPRPRGYRRAYAFQVGLAAAALMFMLWAAELLPGLGVAQSVLISAMASTAFVLFIYPHSTQADARHVIGGHAVAIVAASPFAVFAHAIEGGGFLTGASLMLGFYSAAAVGVSILLMAFLSMEHPPAAATALAIALHGFTWDWAAFIVASVLLMSATHRLLRGRMHNLVGSADGDDLDGGVPRPALTPEGERPAGP